MNTLYISPHKRNIKKQKDNIKGQFNNNISEFPILPTIKTNISNKIKTNSWSNLDTINIINTQTINTETINTPPIKQNAIHRCNKLLHLTLEQKSRDEQNNQYGKESEYWGVKSLLDPDSDHSDNEYDVNKNIELVYNLESKTDEY
jgi:hypothetical protein